MRVIVTRPAAQAGKWVTALRAAGLQALSLPLIEILGPPEPQAVQAVWANLARLQLLMFVSANAVEHFFADQDDGTKLQAALAQGTRFWATGPGTVAALQQAGVPAGHIDAPHKEAAQFDSEALWQVAGAQVRPGWRAVVVRGNSNGQSEGDSVEDGEAGHGVGRDWLAERLREQGVEVQFLVAYARRAPRLAANALALLQVAASDGSVWLFSSSEALANLRSMAAGQSWSRARAVVTHARIAEAAHAVGFGVVRTARPAMKDLLASIESLA
jgi:uroporphyrinogen-III synthase